MTRPLEEVLQAAGDLVKTTAMEVRAILDEAFDQIQGIGSDEGE